MLIVQCLQSQVTDEFMKCEDLKTGMLVQNLVCVVKRVDSIWIDKLKNTIKAVLEIFDETNLYQPIICNLWTPWRSMSGELKAGNLIHLRHFHATSVDNELQLTGYCGLLNVAAFGYNNYGDDIEYIFWSNEPPKEQRVVTASLAKRIKHQRRLISAVFGEMLRIDEDIDTPTQVSAERLSEIFGEATTSLNLDENYDFNTSSAVKPVTTRSSRRKASSKPTIASAKPSTSSSTTEPQVVDENQGMKLLIDWRKEKSDSNLNFHSTNLAAFKIDQALGGNKLKRPVAYAPFELLKPRIKGDVKISKLSECTANGRHNLAVQLIGYEVRSNGSVLRVWDGTNPKFINLDLRDSFVPPSSTVNPTLSRKVGNRFMDILIPKRYNEIVEMFKPGEFMVLIGVKIASLYAPEWTLDGNEGKRVYLLNKHEKLGMKLAGQLDRVLSKELSKASNSRSKSKS